MICSRLSSGRFSQNSDHSGKKAQSKIAAQLASSFAPFEIIMLECFVPPLPWLFVTVPTFDFVGSSGADLGFAVLQEVLERRDQVVFGDFRSNCLLELRSKLEKIFK